MGPLGDPEGGAHRRGVIGYICQDPVRGNGSEEKG